MFVPKVENNAPTDGEAHILQFFKKLGPASAPNQPPMPPTSFTSPHKATYTPLPPPPLQNPSVAATPGHIPFALPPAPQQMPPTVPANNGMLAYPPPSAYPLHAGTAPALPYLAALPSVQQGLRAEHAASAPRASAPAKQSRPSTTITKQQLREALIKLAQVPTAAGTRAIANKFQDDEFVEMVYSQYVSNP